MWFIAYQLYVLYKIYIYKLMQGKFIAEARRPQEIIYIRGMIIFLCGALRPPRRLEFEDCKLSHASDYLRIERNAEEICTQIYVYRFMFMLNNVYGRDSPMDCPELLGLFRIMRWSISSCFDYRDRVDWTTKVSDWKSTGTIPRDSGDCQELFPATAGFLRRSSDIISNNNGRLSD